LVSIDPPAATVFIAEDNPILLQGLGRALTANGYAVETAQDGPSMLSLLSSSSTTPDLLLLDVMMPGMSGFEVLQAVHTEPRWSDLPVVLITAATDETLSTSALRNGAVDVLIKPFRLSELLSRIDGHIRRHRERTATSPVEAD
jgi:two-component system sensor histidine kinase ChiS